MPDRHSSHGATCPVQSLLTSENNATDLPSCTGLSGLPTITRTREKNLVPAAGIETVWRRSNRERREDINTEFKAMADRGSPTKHRNALPLLTLLLPGKQLIAMTASKWPG